MACLTAGPLRRLREKHDPLWRAAAASAVSRKRRREQRTGRCSLLSPCASLPGAGAAQQRATAAFTRGLVRTTL